MSSLVHFSPLQLVVCSATDDDEHRAASADETDIDVDDAEDQRSFALARRFIGTESLCSFEQPLNDDLDDESDCDFVSVEKSLEEELDTESVLLSWDRDLNFGKRTPIDFSKRQ
ncbi:hypothetical protein T4E_4597 [Trichinella pseudospiralis]|uniref:Uncharacterized protein n=1 Tax=Trichinella pseudospiralis TaxID=6337 RepID=A0A0V0Y0K3_TRIPS|nr:hypothetical protein T4E_4597 [Trichinella pseudospiralis]